MYLTLHFIIIFSPFIIFYADASTLDFFLAVNKDAQKHDKEFWENCPGPIGIVAQWFTDLTPASFAISSGTDRENTPF